MRWPSIRFYAFLTLLPNRFMYNSKTASIENVDHQASLAVESHPPPDNCSVCLLQEQRNLDEVSMVLQGGVAWHGNSYHVHDFVMLKADKGPCHIGQIKSINVPDRVPSTISVRLLGRICTMEARPEDVDKDEVRACYFYLFFFNCHNFGALSAICF